MPICPTPRGDATEGGRGRGEVPGPGRGPAERAAGRPAVPHHCCLIGAGFVGPMHVETLQRLGVSVIGVLATMPDESSPEKRATH